MLKRDEVALEELKNFTQVVSILEGAGFTSMTEDQYHAELKRLRFKWITEYNR